MTRWMLPTRYVVAGTVVFAVVVLAIATQRVGRDYALAACAQACGERLDYFVSDTVSGECSCKPDRDLEAAMGRGR